MALPMDTLSPAGSIGGRKWALVVNAIGDRGGRMRRLGGWRRFGHEAGVMYANADLHDKLDGATTPVCEPLGEISLKQEGNDGLRTRLVLIGAVEATRVRWYRDGVLVYDSSIT